MPQKTITLGFIFIFFALITGAATWMTPLSYDDAFNLQVASSLAEHHSYQSKYIPTQIYNDKITTNGPIQYYMAICIKLLGIDQGKAIGLGLIAGFSAVSVYLFSRVAFIVYVEMFFFWALFGGIHTYFWGEAFTITMVMLGLLWWRKLTANKDTIDRENSFHKGILLRDHRIWFTSLFFGIAIATKLLAVAPISILVFCLFFAKRSTLNPPPSNKDVLKMFTYWVILPIGISLLFFFLQFSLSVIHSNGQINTILPILKRFILSHFQQANSSAGNIHTLTQVLSLFLGNPKTGSTTAAILLVVSLGILIKKHCSFFVLAIFFIIIFAGYHLDLRRVIIFSIPTILVTASIIEQKKLCLFTKITKHHINIYPIIFLAIMIIGHTIDRSQNYIIGKLRKFSKAGVSHDYAYASKARKFKYGTTLIPKIKAIEEPIFTSGWFQFPEISLRSSVDFYDRIAPHNRPLLQSKIKKYILFSPMNKEDSLNNSSPCGRIIYRDNALVLCEYNSELRIQ